MTTSISDQTEEAIMEIGDHVCPRDRCGKVFSEPLKLTNLSHRPRVETYYACPFCFSRIEIDEVLASTESAEVKPKAEPEVAASPLKERRNEKITDETNTTASECPHQFGYLKSRSKGEAIPDRCFTCEKILQCMS